MRTATANKQAALTEDPSHRLVATTLAVESFSKQDVFCGEVIWRLSYRDCRGRGGNEGALLRENVFVCSLHGHAAYGGRREYALIANAGRGRLEK